MMKKCIIILIPIVSICLFLIYHLTKNPTYLTKNPTVSVVMSTYNRANMLPTAIESILNQTVKDFEFIIVNDGSKDNTAQVLDSYAQKDKRIKVITNETNLGLIESLNKGLDLAKGKYIARMDDDDKSVPTRFQLQIDFMEKNTDIAVTGTTQFASNKALFVPVQKVDVEASAEKLAVIAHYNVPILHPSAMIRSDFIKQHNIRYEKGYDSAEDTPFWLSIIQKGGKIVRLTPPLVVNTKDSPKKANYYKQQIQSYKKFLNDYLKDVKGAYTFKDLSWLTGNEVCFILQQLKNNPKPYYSSSEIEKLQKEKHCFSQYELFDFSGRNVIIAVNENNWVINNLKFNLEKTEGDKIILSSGDIRIEIQKENGIYRTSNNNKFIMIRHPRWKDSALVSDKQILFLSGIREAKLVSFDDNILKINFETRGEEIYENDGLGTYHFQKK